MASHEFKIALFGTSHAGKSQLVANFLSEPFNPSYEPTIEERYTKEATVDNRYIQLKILDTQGLENFKAMRELYINHSSGFLLVYDASGDDTQLTQLEALTRQIQTLKTNSIPLLIVAAKCDLLGSSNTKLIKQGEKLATKLGKVHVVTSAKNGQGINAAFSIIIASYQKFQAAKKLSENFDTRSTMSVSSVDGWLYNPSERVKANHPPTLKKSILKLRKSVVQLKQSTSIRNIRKVVSSASFYRPNPAAGNPREPPLQSRQHTKHAQPSTMNTPTVQPLSTADYMASDPAAPKVTLVTDDNINDMLDFEELIDASISDPKNKGVCSIM